MEELKENEVWMAGAYSATLDAQIPHIVINDEYPSGRFTTELRQAWEWAHEDATHFNRPEEDNGAVDWVPRVWAGVPPIEFDVLVTPISE
jgi:hypothetical protein